MTLVAELVGSYAITVIAIVAVLFAIIVARALKRDGGIRVARVGVFIERRRYGEPDVEQDDGDSMERYWPPE